MANHQTLSVQLSHLTDFDQTNLLYRSMGKSIIYKTSGEAIIICDQPCPRKSHVVGYLSEDNFIL